MSPPKIGLPNEEGVQEYFSTGRDIYLGARGAIEPGSKEPVDVEGLISQRDGFQVYFFNGTRIGKLQYRAGNLPMKDRLFLRLPDGRIITPIREDEMPSYVGGSLERK